MSVVKGKLVKMEVIQVGEYEFTKQDIIGHGAFAMVYKGRKRKVTICAFFIVLMLLDARIVWQCDVFLGLWDYEWESLF